MEKKTRLRDKMCNVRAAHRDAKCQEEFDVHENEWTSNFCTMVVELMFVVLS